MKKDSLFFIIVALLCLSACNKESRDLVIDTLSGEETLLSKMNRVDNAKGFIVISENSFGLGNKRKSYFLNAVLDSNQVVFFNNIKINHNVTLKRNIPVHGSSTQFLPEKSRSNEENAELFGKTISVGMETGSNQTLETRTANETSIDTPLEMDVTISSTNAPSNSNGTMSVPRNVPLRWTPDSRNRSVYVLLLFDPRHVRNAAHRTARRVSRFHSVSDNGSYTIPASDFSNIPQGAHIEILVARGNTGVIGGTSNGMGSTAIMTYSMAKIIGSTGGGNTGGSGDSCPTCIEVNP